MIDWIKRLFKKEADPLLDWDWESEMEWILDKQRRDWKKYNEAINNIAMEEKERRGRIQASSPMELIKKGML